MTEPADLRRTVAIGTQILARHGLVGMFGHISGYDGSSEDRFLLSPGAGSRKDQCGADDVLEVAFEDSWAPGMPLELYMHSEVHRDHPEVGCLAHLHSPNLTRLSVLEEVPGDVLLLHAAFWPRHVPVYDSPGLIRERGEARDLSALISDSAIALLRWHGAIVVAPTVKEAIYISINAEAHAGMLLAAGESATGVSPLPQAVERNKLHDEIVTERLLDLYWEYEVSKLPAGDPSEGRRHE